MVSKQRSTPRKKKSKVYFGKEVQDAIIRYNFIRTLDGNYFREMNSLYKEIIHPAFAKLSENVINTWKFHNYETCYVDLQSDAVSEMYSQMQKYNPDKGRAFSYFTIICRNFCIIKSKQVTADKNQRDDLNIVDIRRNIPVEISTDDYRSDLQEFIQIFCNRMDVEIHNIFSNNKEIRIADSVLELLRNAPDIDIFNKKVLYIYIRERSGVDTYQITNVTNVLSSIFKREFKEYQIKERGELYGQEF